MIRARIDPDFSSSFQGSNFEPETGMDSVPETWSNSTMITAWNFELELSSKFPGLFRPWNSRSKMHRKVPGSFRPWIFSRPKMRQIFNLNNSRSISTLECKVDFIENSGPESWLNFPGLFQGRFEPESWSKFRARIMVEGILWSIRPGIVTMIRVRIELESWSENFTCVSRSSSTFGELDLLLKVTI